MREYSNLYLCRKQGDIYEPVDVGVFKIVGTKAVREFYIYTPNNTDIRQFEVDNGHVYRLDVKNPIQIEVRKFIDSQTPVAEKLRNFLNEPVKITEGYVQIGCHVIPKKLIKDFAEEL